MPITVVPRRQQAEERREQILDAALRVFAEKGFSGASIRDIAREVGVTEGLLYHYFESKDELMRACWKERSWHAHLERILANSDGVPIGDVLRDMVSDFLATMREHGAKVRMCMAEMQRNEAMALQHIERIEESQKLIHTFLNARQAEGEIRPDADAGMAAGLLLGCAQSLFVIWGRADDEQWDKMAANLIHEGVDIVLRGISMPAQNAG